MSTKLKKLTTLFKACIFILLFTGCGKLFCFLLVDDTSSFTRIMMHEFYHQEDNIDVLFVGSSHCYFSFVPTITDRILGKNTFCAGSSAQQLDASYEIIKEADRLNDLEHIYLEVYYGLANYSLYKERTLMTSTYIVSDYLRPSFDKLAFLLKASSKEYYSNSFITARRNWENFFETDYVMYLIQQKTSPKYQNFSYDYVSTADKQYAGKGYVKNEGYAPEYFFLSYYPMYTPGFSKDWENSLNEIIDYCLENQIPLTLVSAPMPNYSLAALGDYDTYASKINQIINGRNIEYYDFNLCKEAYIPNTTAIFRDSDHLNTEGAEVFSTVFSQFCMGQIAKQDLFYNTFNEKLAHLEAAVYGLNYQEQLVKESEDMFLRYVTIISGYPDDTEYRIVITPENKAPYLIQDFSTNKDFTLPPEEHGVCTLTIKPFNASVATMKTIEIVY